MVFPVRLQTHVYHPFGDRRALLLHGLTSDGSCWWRLASELAEAGWTVLAPDLRGHGRSPAAAAYDLASLAADVRLLGTHWDLVVGHCLGGAIAARLLAEPTVTVTAAVLLDPVLVLAPDERAVLHATVRAEAGGLDPAAIAHPGWHPTDIAPLASAAGPPDVVDAVLAADDWDVTGALARTSARIHLLTADPSRGGLLTSELAVALADGARITHEVVPGAGRSVLRDRPERVLAAVRAVTDGV